MDRKSVTPIFPEAPREYTVRWGNELVRSLDQLVTLLRNPGEGRFTAVSITNIPDSDFGLEAGSLFRQGNQVYIALLNQPYARGLAATARLGTVTVTVV
jgi:hypothetical protein